MNTNGGYILHLDGTCDKGRNPFLISVLDSISEIVLGNIKAPTEKSEYIIPLLEQVKKMFGNPLALVRDMGTAISRAIETVFPKKPDFICHYHFLSDIGGDLLEAALSAVIRRRVDLGRGHVIAVGRAAGDEDPAVVQSYGGMMVAPPGHVSGCGTE